MIVVLVIKPSGHLAASVSVRNFWTAEWNKSNAGIRGYHPRHTIMFLVLTSEEVLVRVAPAGDVFDGDHQTAARAAARPTGRGLTPEEC